MGKHRSSAQEKIFTDFMEQHNDIARGYTKGDRVIVESHWQELTKDLNGCGPPIKDVNGWKKTWADWKTYVKKKMCHNKRENKKTGGGEYNKYVLTDVEESIARICGLYKSNDGISGAKPFPLYNADCEKENDELDVTLSPNNSNSSLNGPSTTTPTSPQKKTKRSVKRPCSTLDTFLQKKTKDLYTLDTPFVEISPLQVNPTTPTNSRQINRAKTTPKPDVSSLLVEENQHLKNLVRVMEEKLQEEKRVTKVMEEQRDQMIAQNQNISRLCNIFEKCLEAKKLNDIEMHKKICEKNEIKLKLLELGTLKLEIEPNFL